MLTVVDHDGVAVVTMSAPADMTAAEATAFDAAAQAVPPGARTVLDLSSAGSLDSAGVGCLIRLHRRLDAAGGELRLAGPSSAVATVLDLVRLHRLLEVHPTLAAAVLSFRETDAR